MVARRSHPAECRRRCARNRRTTWRDHRPPDGGHRCGPWPVGTTRNALILPAGRHNPAPSLARIAARPYRNARRQPRRSAVLGGSRIRDPIVPIRTGRGHDRLTATPGCREFAYAPPQYVDVYPIPRMLPPTPWPPSKASCGRASRQRPRWHRSERLVMSERTLHRHLAAAGHKFGAAVRQRAAQSS